MQVWVPSASSCALGLTGRPRCADSLLSEGLVFWDTLAEAHQAWGNFCKGQGTLGFHPEC